MIKELMVKIGIGLGSAVLGGVAVYAVKKACKAKPFLKAKNEIEAEEILGRSMTSEEALDFYRSKAVEVEDISTMSKVELAFVKSEAKTAKERDIDFAELQKRYFEEKERMDDIALKQAYKLGYEQGLKS